ncbi:MAG: hypothetical protein ACXWZ2_04055, partial [Mycobacterium sp.]
MGASAYVGRVGGLAVALGVGAAVATGHGVAWAETESGSSTSESSASTGGASSTSDDRTATTAGDVDEDTVEEDTDTVEEDTDAVEEDTDTVEVAPEEVPEPEPEPEPETPAEETTTPQPTGGNSSVAEQNARSNERAAMTTSLAARTMNVTPTTAGDTNESGTVEASTQENVKENVKENTVFTAFTLDAEPTENLAAVTMTSPVTNTLEQPLTLNQPLLERVVVNLLSSLGLGA